MKYFAPPQFFLPQTFGLPTAMLPDSYSDYSTRVSTAKLLIPNVDQCSALLVSCTGLSSQSFRCNIINFTLISSKVVARVHVLIDYLSARCPKHVNQQRTQ